MRARTLLVPLASLALCVGYPTHSASAQGYGEQRAIPFRVHGQDTNTRLSREVSRQSLSLQYTARQQAGISGGASGVSALDTRSQATSGMNNVVQYYDNSTINVAVPGSGSTVSVGDVLNAGQTSSDTRQQSTNTTDSVIGGRPLTNSPLSAR
ncbi:hypothetical protein [Falsiroseomonas stagni]|uniref:Curlin associated repeat-containing protein n=1 Tax=Falsiroseomonas stagni DSM 19981 TaxID=1123062 RepID=A0A1I4EY93_9PROT|nr:hypothetical protein [Falsiroseomonas stagni]SFL09547.1 hypothetical protein SAMN02745775_11944 [Falsiroseomonas stagni DSM 19981]